MSKCEFIPVRKCVVCGKWFFSNVVNKICCSKECYKERNRELNRNAKMRKEKEAEAVKIKKKQQVSFNDIIRLAKEEGISYGEYVSRHNF